MSTVYAVTYGEYSDYRVDCLFTDRELADRYVATIGGEVEEMELHDSLPKARVLCRIETRVRLYLHYRPAQVAADNALESAMPHFPGVNGPRGNRPVVKVTRRNWRDTGILAQVEVAGYDETTVRQAYSDTVAPLVIEGEAIVAAEVAARAVEGGAT